MAEVFSVFRQLMIIYCQWQPHIVTGNASCKLHREPWNYCEFNWRVRIDRSAQLLPSWWVYVNYNGFTTMLSRWHGHIRAHGYNMKEYTCILWSYEVKNYNNAWLLWINWVGRHVKCGRCVLSYSCLDIIFVSTCMAIWFI